MDSIVNFRELGGYRLPNGKVVRHGKLFRGGSLENVSCRDIEQLRKWRIMYVFDFRTMYETEHHPDKMLMGASRIWLPTFDESAESMAKTVLPLEAYHDLGGWLVVNAKRAEVQKLASKMYLDMVHNEYTQLQYAAFLQTIVNSNGGAIYWHCSQGKDRTGLGAAYLLAALGADRQTIMDDFNASADCYAEELSRYICQVESDEEKEVLQTFVSVNSRYFSEALDSIDQAYGSMEAFLRDVLCLTDHDKSVLQKAYLEDSFSLSIKRQ